MSAPRMFVRPTPDVDSALVESALIESALIESAVVESALVARRRCRRVWMLRRRRRRRSRRAGFTLLELVVALGLFLAVAFLTASISDVQRRALTTTMRNARAQRTAAQAVDAVSAQLRGVAPADITLAADTAVELQLAVAEGVVCQPPTGPLVLLPPLGRAGEGARTRWRAMPEADDAALFLDPGDRTPSAWRRARVVSAALRHGATLCPPPTGVTAGFIAPAMAGEPRLELQLDALPAGVVAGTVVRVQRRLRLVIYRAADGTGQLGVRRCPADLAAPCAAVQPAVGPLLTPSAVAANSGFHFVYQDSTGAAVGPAAPERIAMIHLAAQAPRPDGHERVEAWLALRGAR